MYITHRYINVFFFWHDEQVHPLLMTNVFHIQYRPSIISSAQPMNVQNWREYWNATTWANHYDWSIRSRHFVFLGHMKPTVWCIHVHVYNVSVQSPNLLWYAIPWKVYFMESRVYRLFYWCPWTYSFIIRFGYLLKLLSKYELLDQKLAETLKQ